MKRKVILASLALVTCGIVVAWSFMTVHPTSAQTGTKPAKTSEELIARGKYLVDFGGCNDCHSPKNMTDKGPVPDPQRILSGHPGDSKLAAFDKQMVTSGSWFLFTPDLTAAVGPWGVSYAFNLSPDTNTGIGLWTEEMFVKAMRTGKHMGMGRAILPPMPWMSVGSLTDKDLGAVFAYLKSLPPVKNAVPGAVSLDEYLGTGK
jgi:hypothetical protein